VLPQGTNLLAAAGVPTEGEGISSGSDASSIVSSLVVVLEEHRVWKRVVLA
jgi:catalase